VRRQVSNPAVDAQGFETGCMQNRDHVSWCGALEILIAINRGVIEETLIGAGKERPRLHFRVHRLSKDVIESETEDKRAEIVNAAHDTEIAKYVFGVETCFMSPLVYYGIPETSVENPEVVQIHVAFLAGSGAELPTRGPPAERKVFRSNHGIHTAVDGPKNRFPHDGSLGRRAPHIGNQKPGLPRYAFDGMSGKQKIEDGNAFDSKTAAVNGGVPARVHNHGMCSELPFGPREFASCDRTVVNHIVLGGCFLDDLAGKGKRIGGSQDEALAA